jgi:DNA repair protein RadC
MITPGNNTPPVTFLLTKKCGNFTIGMSVTKRVRLSLSGILLHSVWSGVVVSVRPTALFLERTHLAIFVLAGVQPKRRHHMVLKVVTQGKPFRNITITSSQDVCKVMAFLAKADREMIYILHLDNRGGLIAKESVAVGSINAASAPIREIFKGAMLNNTVSIILVHNHPTGDDTPSLEDVRFTALVKQAGTILGIQVLDHVIIAGMRSASIGSITEAQWYKEYSNIARNAMTPAAWHTNVAEMKKKKQKQTRQEESAIKTRMIDTISRMEEGEFKDSAIKLYEEATGEMYPVISEKKEG